VVAAEEETAEEGEVAVVMVQEEDGFNVGEVEDGFSISETRALRNTSLRLPGWFTIANPSWSADGPCRKRCPTLMPACTLKISVGLARWTKFWGRFKTCTSP
jgi:hypothetical protein